MNYSAINLGVLGRAAGIVVAAFTVATLATAEEVRLVALKSLQVGAIASQSVASQAVAGPAPAYTLRPSDRSASNFFNSTLAYSIVVISTSTGAIIPNATITVTAPKARSFTGGHDHDDPARPTGTLSYLTGNTGPTGYDFSPTFTAPEVSGVIDIYGSCFAPGLVCLSNEPLPIGVLVPDLVDLGSAVDYDLTGSSGSPGVTSQHAANHFGTVSFTSKLRALATTYFLQYATAGNAKLKYNDIALEQGGLFDVYNNWAPSHWEHRIGISADVGLVPVARRNVLRSLMPYVGITGVLYVEGNHWHIREFGSRQ